MFLPSRTVISLNTLPPDIFTRRQWILTLRWSSRHKNFTTGRWFAKPKGLLLCFSLNTSELIFSGPTWTGFHSKVSRRLEYLSHIPAKVHLLTACSSKVTQFQSRRPVFVVVVVFCCRLFFFQSQSCSYYLVLSTIWYHSFLLLFCSSASYDRSLFNGRSKTSLISRLILFLAPYWVAVFICKMSTI